MLLLELLSSSTMKVNSLKNATSKFMHGDTSDVKLHTKHS